MRGEIVGHILALGPGLGFGDDPADATTPEAFPNERTHVLLDGLEFRAEARTGEDGIPTAVVEIRNPTDSTLAPSAEVLLLSYDAASMFSRMPTPPEVVAGVAALLLQMRDEKSANQADDLEALLHDIGLNGQGGANDLGAAGFDTVYGYGRIKLDSCSESFTLTKGLWTMFGLPCNRGDDSTISAVLADDLGSGASEEKFVTYI